MSTDNVVNVMVDLETLGLGESSIIMSIGAAVFSADTGVGEPFCMQIDPETYPGTMDVSTVKFWFDMAAKGINPPLDGFFSASEAATAFHDWLTLMAGERELILWANGTDFDIPKLNHLFKQTKTPCPWKYNNVRDARTIFKLFGAYAAKPERVQEHHAMHDAVWQAKYLCRILKALTEKGVYAEQF